MTANSTTDAVPVGNMNRSSLPVPWFPMSHFNPLAFIRTLIHHLRHRPAPEVTSSNHQLLVHHVDDPESSMRLIRAAGLVGPETIDRLVEAWSHVTVPYALHLDLFDARISDTTTAQRLESALDHLERQQIAVRVVGLDPSHPAIAS